MLYLLPYIRSLPHSWFYCHFVFSMKSDRIAVKDTTGYLADFVVLCTYIGANGFYHLIGPDDENILSSYIDHSDETIHLLRYMHTKQQRWPFIRLYPSQQSNQATVHIWTKQLCQLHLIPLTLVY